MFYKYSLDEQNKKIGLSSGTISERENSVNNNTVT